ncbi:MAG TPA: TIGR03619 family F420-dependent LLM class oxidoreductase [Acidimicrobiales bacterium]|nr:TIGR03619 family F420-dependent LLM class oxidoreductase [Acidimicrobiales bacterium]
MRLSLGLETSRSDRAEEFVSAAAIAEMSQAAERAGFDSVFVTDHPFPDDAWLAGGGHHALDPFVALAFAAAATTTLRLHTNLYVAAYRNPFLSAKAVATLDHLSGGRVVLGIGAGYLEPEFDALGVDFAERNDLTDEAIVMMKRAWVEAGVAAKGAHFDASAGHTMLPRPVQQPHPPIWIGGNSKRAIRRAVDLADGWMPMPNPAKYAARRRSPALESLDDVKAGIAYAAEYGASVGRAAPIGVMYALGRDTPEELAAAGVTELYTIVRGADTRAAWLAEVERLGNDVVPAVKIL